MRRSSRSLALIPAIALLAVAPVHAIAQEVQYTSVTKADLGGFINTLARLGGGSLEVEEKTYIKGGKMRTDSEQSSTIMDFENGRYIFIDHDAKTYSVVTLQQMVEMAQRAASQVSSQQSSGGYGDGKIRTDSGDVDLDFQLSVDRTSETQKVNGWNARRALVTMRTDATVTPEGEEEQEAGSLIVFIDMWASTDVPAHSATLQLHQNEAAKRYLGEAGNSAQTIGAAFAGDPQMSAALRKAGEEMQKIEGTPVRSTTYLVALAPGNEFDPRQVLEPKQKESAAKKIGRGMLGGVLGRAGKQQEEEPVEEQPTQKTIFNVTTEMRDVKTGSVSDSLFDPPTGYREVSG